MRDRPIIFSAPMVRALLAGTKTQTRRLAWVKGRSMAMRRASPWQRVQPGARLWVRENWQFAPQRYCSCPQGAEPAPCDDWQDGTGCQSNRGGVVYAADDVKAARWRPSIHMPRWASRITLHVEAVRVQRLQDISEGDARAEGIYWSEEMDGWTSGAGADESCDFHGSRPEEAFRKLWGRLHGPDAWAENPWVVALTFRVTKGNIDALIHDPAAIAARLTPAQKRALLWLPSDGSAAMPENAPCRLDVMRRLREAGLAAWAPLVMVVATDLGLRVRAVLEARGNA